MKDLPDITDQNKKLIKMLLSQYCQILKRISFENGITLYTETFNELYTSSARWKVCLLCGEIRRLNGFVIRNHDCSPILYHNFPILVQTSWINLQDFFLSDKFLNLLRERGMESEITNEVIK